MDKMSESTLPSRRSGIYIPGMFSMPEGDVLGRNGDELVLDVLSLAASAHICKAERPEGPRVFVYLFIAMCG